MRLSRLAVFLGLLVSAAAQGQKRSITATDLFAFHWIGDTQLSPDGHTVAFVQTSVNEDKSGYETSLYALDTAVPGATPHLLLAGNHDSSPRWSPDGRQLIFLRAVEKEGKPQPPQLYLMDVSPLDTPHRLTDLPKGVSSPAWSGSSNWTVLSSTPKMPTPAPKPGAHVSDVRIINREIYRSNGEGYVDPAMVPQIYRISASLPEGKPAPAEQLTSGRYGVEEYIAVGGGSFLFTSTHSEEPYYDAYDHNQIYLLNAPEGDASARKVVLVQDLPFSARGLSVAPHAGSSHTMQLAFHAADAPRPPAKPVSHQQTDLFTFSLDLDHLPATASPVNLTGGQGYEMGGGVGGDNTAPRGGGRPSVAWNTDGSQLLDLAGSQGSALLVAVSATGGPIQKLSARREAVLNFAATSDQKTVIALISNPILIGDLFRIDPTGTPGGPANGTAPPSAGNQSQLTHINDALFSQLDLEMPQDLHVQPTVHPADIPFLSIDTFVQLPPGFDKTRKYPAILNIHGGPHSAYGWVFDHEMLYMAAKGYVVIYPNPRGSTTYGQQFANVIENNYPGDDFHDLMDTVDAVIAKGWADPDKLGVTGGSGGGLLTDWTVTQTNRFKAAVAQRDIVDAANWWYTADIGEFHQYWWPEAPFESQAHLDLYRKLSPLTYVNNIKTPMMFILGDADYRTPPTAGGEIFFRALKYKKIPTVMVRFPRESHELSRSGEPWHRIERLENIVNWFDRYLLGTPEPQYDIPSAP